MSSVVSSIFGGGGSAAGTVQSPVNQQQISDLYGGVSSGLAGQQAFLQALQAQNGIGNQSSVFNQLQGVANGTGPNPAETQLANATGANVSNQAALMAGQRGSSANPGLIARQASMQGADTQQQAAGQAANLQANQSLNALGAMGSLANQQVANQGAATQGITGAANQGFSTAVGAQNQTNQINSQAQQAQAAAQGNVLSGLTGALGTGAGMLFGGPAGAVAGGALGKSLGGSIFSADAGSGMAPSAGTVGGVSIPSQFKYAEGGTVSTGPRSLAAKHMAMYAEGGKVPAMVSPGEQYLPPKAAKEVAEGKAKPLSVGERIPGTPKVAGNSYQNDTVPKTLQQGGIVIPNAIMQSDDPEGKAAAFVRACMAKKGLSKA